MAPEQLDSQYDEKVDVYALGMCIIEMITKTYPYEECRNIIEVFRAIDQRKDCLALSRIRHVNTYAFIQWCCQRQPVDRPSANEALQHVWLQRPTPADNHYCEDL